MAEVKTRYFELLNTKSSKYWEMSWDGGTTFTVRFGKIGAAGRTSTKTFATADEAKTAANLLMIAKHAKGYAYKASDHWFERYREHYAAWWLDVVAELDEDERGDLMEYEFADKLRPISDEALRRLGKAFPELPAPLRTFLKKFGTGLLYFRGPSKNDDEPLVYSIFTSDEVMARVASLAKQAEQELEDLDEHFYHCDAHGEDKEKCRTLLKAVRDEPTRFYPFFGPDCVYDFIYVVHSGPGAGTVGRWYHDYPVCELLDGSGIVESLDAYGGELLRMTDDGEEYPI